MWLNEDKNCLKIFRTKGEKCFPKNPKNVEKRISKDPKTKKSRKEAGFMK